MHRHTARRRALRIALGILAAVILISAPSNITYFFSWYLTAQANGGLGPNPNTRTGDLRWFGGPLLGGVSGLRVYALFLRPPGFHFVPGRADTSYVAMQSRFLRDLAAPNEYLHLLGQYDHSARGLPISNAPIPDHIVLAGTFVDEAAQPHAGTARDPLWDDNLRADILRDGRRQGWDISGLSSLVIVYTPTGLVECDPLEPGQPACNNWGDPAVYCGYHDAWDATGSGAPIVYAYISGGLDTACPAPSTPNDPANDAAIGVVSHELAEALTDPLPSSNPAWADSAGFEIADKCQYAGDRGGVFLAGHRYQVAELWSNRTGLCDA